MVFYCVRFRTFHFKTEDLEERGLLQLGWNQKSPAKGHQAEVQDDYITQTLSNL